MPSMVTRPPSMARWGWMAVTSSFNLLCVVELDVPIQVIAPAFRRVAQSNGDADGRRRRGAPRHPPQTHAGFSRRSATFLSVARDAARDDVFPVFSAAMGDRQHMIEGQLARRERVAAVLA